MQLACGFQIEDIAFSFHSIRILSLTFCKNQGEIDRRFYYEK